ncbi:MAG: hypothetical protein IPL46_09720 [Saprospiraceae bacterium]|nr:hypothetical protein [Saprospiraceae bacterium]
MVLLAGFFLKFYDQITIIAGGFGLLAIAGLIKTLYSEGLPKLFIAGIILTLLILVNNFIYFTKVGISFLPFIQKITFFVLFSWIMWINLTLINRLGQGEMGQK